MIKNDTPSVCRRAFSWKVIRLRYFCISCFLFAFLCTGVLSAQTFEQTKPQSDVTEENREPEKPVAIPITKISSRAQDAYLLLNQINADLKPITEILIIREKLPLFLSSMNKLRTSWIYLSLNNLTTRKLQKLSHDWNTQLNKLKQWEETLVERSELLDEDIRQLDEMAVIWRLTFDTAIAKDAPEVIQERAKTTLDQISDTKTKITEEIKVLLTFRDQISEQELEVTKLIGLIGNAEAQSKTQLFVRDSPPYGKLFRTLKVYRDLVVRFLYPLSIFSTWTVNIFMPAEAVASFIS